MEKYCWIQQLAHIKEGGTKMARSLPGQCTLAHQKLQTEEDKVLLVQDILTAKHKIQFTIWPMKKIVSVILFFLKDVLPLTMSNKKFPIQYVIGRTPETKCKCFPPLFLSSIRYTVNDAGIKLSAKIIQIA